MKYRQKKSIVRSIKIKKKVLQQGELEAFEFDSPELREFGQKHKVCPLCKLKIKKDYEKHVSKNCQLLPLNIKNKVKVRKLPSTPFKTYKRIISNKKELNTWENSKVEREEIKRALKEKKINEIQDQITDLKKRQTRLEKGFNSELIKSSILKIELEIRKKEIELNKLLGKSIVEEDLKEVIAKINIKNNTNLAIEIDSKIEIHQTNLESDTNIIVEKIYWTLLPEGEWSFNEVRNHFRQLSSTKKWKNKSFDESRLQKIEGFLKPNKCYIGKDEFEGYIVYCFDWTKHIVLECPIYGNAIYVIKNGQYNWQQIARATKWEARTKHSAQVKVINHSETWLDRLENYLMFEF